jgi:hypothetical protein
LSLYHFMERFVASVGDEGIQTEIYCGTAGWNEITARRTALSTLPLWWSSHGRSGTARTTAVVSYQRSSAAATAWTILVQVASETALRGKAWPGAVRGVACTS